MPNHEIEINRQFRKALDTVENSRRSLIVTGSAGTGKSTLVEYMKRSSAKNMVVLAPTGVAALNAGGMTIHSFFRFGPGITVGKVKKLRKNTLYKKIEVLVIDEISMVRADLLDCVDRFMRLNGMNKDEPFGGAQAVFVGDLYQLPPVVSTDEEKEFFSGHYRSEYFFDSRVFEKMDYEVLELEKIYRQKDAGFIRILNRIRTNSATEEDLDVINERFGKRAPGGGEGFTVCLTTTNMEARAVNNGRLAGLPGSVRELEAEVEGDCGAKHFPTDAVLALKEGAQVMLLNNDSSGRWVNGSVGRVVAIEPGGREKIMVELPGGPAEVSPFNWKVYRFVYNEAGRRIEAEESGHFRQYPLRLAWAITIHKSQGKTFTRVEVDTGRGTFAHGQMYVALSRCISLEGLFLKRKAERRHMSVDERVVSFLGKAISPSA